MIQTTKLLSELEASEREQWGDQVKASAAAGAGKNKSNKFLYNCDKRERTDEVGGGQSRLSSKSIEEAHKHLARC